MVLDRAQSFFARIHDQRFGEILVEDRVGEHGQAGNVIEMRVRKKDVANRCEFVERKIPYARAGINEDVVVDQHR